MNDKFRLGPLGQVSRQTADIERATAWYRDVLGLPHLYTFGKLAFFDCGGTRLFLSPPEDGGEVGPQSILYFRVDDIAAAHRELEARGVHFIEAPQMIFRHESGMEEWLAAFYDPDGNPLALMSQVPPL